MAMPLSSRRPSARESAAAAGVCLALVAALVWLIRTQAHFSPAVTVELAPAGAGAGSAPARPAIPDLVSPWPGELKPMSGAEAFTPATLSDKIDGKAEVYLPAGVIGLRCQRATLISAPQTWLEMFVFDMGSPDKAYSVYSFQRRPDVIDMSLGDYAYRAGNELAFVHGRFYVELVATDEAPATIAAATVLAKAYVAATAIAEHADVSTDQALFPREGLVAGSVTLVSADVFGFDGLKDVFAAQYRDGADEVTLFVARRAGRADASAAAAALVGFFVKDCGGKEIGRLPSPAGAVIVDSGGSFEGVFAAGAFLAGVHQAPSRESAERWVRLLSQNLPSKP
jgi:hypothetical protein